MIIAMTLHEFPVLVTGVLGTGNSHYSLLLLVSRRSVGVTQVVGPRVLDCRKVFGIFGNLWPVSGVGGWGTFHVFAPLYNTLRKDVEEEKLSQASTPLAEVRSHLTPKPPIQ